MNIEPTPVRYPIDIRCPIGGGVFAKGKAGKFSVGGTPTPAQNGAVEAYKGSQYVTMNGALRGEMPQTNPKKTESLTSLIEHHGVTEKSGIVYRGVNGKTVESVDFASKIGQKITLPGFISTSKNERFARGWASGDGAILRIYVPKGTKALDYESLVNKMAGTSHFKDGEHEVILPHNSKFTVHAVGKDKSGKPIIDLIMHR